MYGDLRTKEERLNKRSADDRLEYLAGWGLSILGAIIFAYMLWHAGMVDILYGVQ